MNNLENLNVMYHHGYTVGTKEKPEGYRFTIAGIIENTELILSLAICADGDVFSKVKGRMISTGRLLCQRNRYGRGVIIRSVYALHNQFETETGFPIDYFNGNEIKIFREEARNYDYFTKKELVREFRLR